MPPNARVFLRDVLFQAVELKKKPVFLAKPHHGPLRPEGHGDLRGDLRGERSIKSHYIYVPNGLRPPFFALYYPYYRHIFVYPFFNSVPGRGSVSIVDERRQCIIIVYGDLLWNALVVERASTQYDHVHTFHRSTSSVGLACADGEFPVTRAATELMHDLRRKNPQRIPLLCSFFHFFVHPSGPRLAAPRWVKASYRWSGYDLGLGGEEFGSG